MNIEGAEGWAWMNPTEANERLAQPPAVGHSHVGPSSVAHYLTCPAFEPPPQPVDEEDDDPAVRGRLLHAAMERGDWSDLDPHEQDLCDWADEQRRILADGFEDVETEVTMFIVPGMTGTADLVASRHRDLPSMGLVLDYKFGRIPVSPASENWQGISYGLGLVKRFAHLRSVRVGFIQPLLHYVTFHEYGLDELLRREMTLERVVAMAENHRRGLTSNTPVPTHTACRYCSKALTCPERIQWLGGVNRQLTVAAQRGALTPPTGWTHDPHTWDTPEKVDFGIKFLDTISRWAPAAKTVVVEKLTEAPELSTEYRVAEVAGQKRIHPEATDAQLATVLDVDPSDIAPLRGRVSVKDLRKFLRSLGLKKEGIEEAFEELGDHGLLVTGASSPRIVEQKHASTPISLPEDRDES